MTLKAQFATNTETGEIVQISGVREFDRADFLVRKYALQDAIKAVLPWKFLKDGKEVKHRVKGCLSAQRQQGAEMKNPEIHKSAKSGAATWKNLQLCGSAWTCPVCAGKISERRAAIIHDVSDKHLSAGGGLLLLTLTFAHRSGQSAKHLADKLTSAWSSFAKDKAVVNALYSAGCLGGVRSLEVTWGKKNGWHPHIHVLLYVSKSADTDEGREELRAELFRRWLAYCKKRGLGEPNEKHGVRVDSGDFASKYVAKHGDWNSAKEITKQNIKKAKGADNFKPFELAAMTQVEPENAKEWGALFQEYAEAFHRKQQTVWYRLKNIREHYEVASMADLKDADLAEAEIEDLVMLGELSAFQFARIAENKKRGVALVLAENGGIEAVKKMAAGLPASKLEIEMMALEEYTLDGRVKESRFADSPQGRLEFYQYLAKVRTSTKFADICAKYSRIDWPNVPTSLWAKRFI